MTLDPRDTANPMLPALARWRGWPRVVRPATRWRIARRRSGRIEDRLRPGSALHRMGGRPVRVMSRHQTLRSVTYAPRWAVTVQAHTSTPVSAAPAQGARSELVLARFRPAMHLVTAPAPGRPVAAVAGSGQRPASTNLTTLHTAQQVEASAPITRRLVETVVERVTREHRRIETRQQAPVIVRERASVAAEVERALTSVRERAPEQPGSPLARGNWPGGNEPVPPVGPDLDRLTDQIVSRIDDRLTAHRERMGRVF